VKELMMINEQVAKIQRGLFTRGYLVGEVDGIWGRHTITALKAFQEDAGLKIDGIFGPRTARKLFPLNGDALMAPLLPWIAAAQSMKGLREVAGPGNNPDIITMAKDLDILYRSDDIPWCGLFVAHAIASTLPEEVLPSNPLGARSWERFGESTAPRAGAVMVFWRESPESGLGHVGFYVGENKDEYIILGGNQSNIVREASYPKSQFLKARWPKTATSLGGGPAIVPIELAQDGTLKKLAQMSHQQSAPH
jgi:uncharacterized protein (TIGR02594 family)